METGTVNYRSTTVDLGGDGIMYCRAIANDNYDEHDLAALRDIMIKLSNGNRFRVLMEMKEFEILLTKAARNFMANDEQSAHSIIAEAVVLQSSTLRILFNLIMMVNRPKFPFQAFNNEEKAVEWLLSHS